MSARACTESFVARGASVRYCHCQTFDTESWRQEAEILLREEGNPIDDRQVASTDAGASPGRRLSGGLLRQGKVVEESSATQATQEKITYAAVH